MKKFLRIIFLIFICFPLNCETLNLAEERIKEIEEFKSIVCTDEKFRKDPLSEGEKEILKSFYENLENDEYEITSDDGLFFKIEGYDIEKNGWPIRYGFSFLDYAYSLEKKDILLYSAVLDRHYVNPLKMTQLQREDYENLVEEYDERFENGEKILVAKLKFKVRHWENASEYRIEPISLRIYKIRFNEKKIFEIPLTESETFTVYPKYEFRTESEFNRERDRIRKLKKKPEPVAAVREDEENEIFEDEKYKNIQKKRNAIYGTFALKKDGLPFDSGNFEIGSFGLNFVFGLAQHLYAGIGASYSPREYNGNPVYIFDGKLGACCNLTSFLRPFIEVSGGGSTDVCAHISPGAGFDFILSALMLTFQYKYDFIHNFQDFSNKRESNSPELAPTECWHSFSVGLGISW